MRSGRRGTNDQNTRGFLFRFFFLFPHTAFLLSGNYNLEEFLFFLSFYDQNPDTTLEPPKLLPVLVHVVIARGKQTLLSP